MFGLPTFRIGRLFGIPLEIDASWLLIFVLVAASLSLSYFPTAYPNASAYLYVALGVITAVAFFASLVIHELAHSLVARAGGLRISKVTLFMFGGVSQMEDEPRSPGHEFLLALAGPMTSVLLGLGALGIRALLISAKVPGFVWLPFEYLGLINLALAAFNLLPGFPLDGGRVFRAILWATTKDILKATRWASRAGQAIGMGLIAVAVFGVLRGTFDLVWFAVMGWFLSNMSAVAYQQQLLRATLAQVQLKNVMSGPVDLAPVTVTLQQMADQYFRGRHTHYPVVDDGHIVGLIDPSYLTQVPQEQWASTKVGDVASRDVAGVVARPDASVDSVLSRLEPGGPGVVLVVDDGHLAGVVTRADVIRFIRESSRHP